MTRIDYSFADGTFQRIRLSRLPREVARELAKWERRDERAIERDCKYRDGRGYYEGDSETLMREVNYSDPVADVAEDNAMAVAMRDAVSQLNPTMQRRIWLFAQGNTSTEIAEMDGVSLVAVHKSIKLAKKKIKNYLKMG